MLEEHLGRGADLTVSCIEVPRAEAGQFGIVSVDGEDRIVAFVEKPANPPAMPGQRDRSMASMSVYVFDAARLFK